MVSRLAPDDDRLDELLDVDVEMDDERHADLAVESDAELDRLLGDVE